MQNERQPGLSFALFENARFLAYSASRHSRFQSNRGLAVSNYADS